MTHTYRYYACDLLTGNIIADLPLYGVYCNRRINQAGSLTGSFRLGTGVHDDNSLIEATIPGRTEAYVERDGELVWGGIIWSRTYSSEAHLVSLTGQTFESIFDHVVIDANFIYQYVEQTTILSALIDLIQSQSGSNFRLLKDTFPTTGVNRTVLIPGYEYHFAQEIVDQLINVDGGLELAIDITPSATQDRPNRTVRVGYPQLGNAVATSGLYLDYPGSISQYWWSESGTRGATKAAALGRGDGFNTIRAQVIDGDKIAAGWPAWWVVNSHPNIADVNSIGEAARKDLDKWAIPVQRPTLQYDQESGARFSSWNNLGDEVRFRIQDPRFPDGKIAQSRMIGWELSPAESESDETIKIVLEGEDEV